MMTDNKSKGSGMEKGMQFTEADLGPNFTMKEIAASGAKMEKIQRELILNLVSFRALVSRRVTLLRDGLTSGDHEPNGEHPNGRAVDFTITFDLETEGIDWVVERMQRAGFRGIGVYFNGKIYSFHGDIRPLSEFWSGTKRAPGVGKWVYGKLIAPLSLAKDTGAIG